ncbi:hypothetical protein ACFZB9_31915 [Kitasatospora sp. NPDC008050]|uniref:hypothetical protein n=1 Tax=Kitasatospora sp. NPDC008050 TaxID=3364021 RepID=UPI0036F01E5F
MISLRIRAALYAAALVLLAVPTPAQARPLDTTRPTGPAEAHCRQQYGPLKAAPDGPPCRPPHRTRPSGVA